eukprot:11565839-Alexandrium_andersonii.AAC.1
MLFSDGRILADEVVNDERRADRLLVGTTAPGHGLWQAAYRYCHSVRPGRRYGGWVREAEMHGPSTGH